MASVFFFRCPRRSPTGAGIADPTSEEIDLR